jgi:hypothetical protein
MFVLLQKICWTQHTTGAAIQHMRIDHRRLHVTVTQQLLNGSNVVTTLQQVGGKRMPKGVTPGLLIDSCFQDCSFHGLLDQGRVDVVPAFGSFLLITPAVSLQKHPLSGPL